MPGSLPAAACALAAIAAALPAHGAEPGAQGGARVIVIAAAEGGAAAAREARFVEEVRLAFDDIEVGVLAAPGAGFGRQPLAEQIAWVRAAIAREGATAALWISAADDIVLLHIVVLATERIVVRMVQVEAREGFETDLAMSARESLGEAFLLARPPAAAPVAAIVEEVRAEAAPSAPPPAPGRPPWEAWAGPIAEVALTDGRGPPLRLGGAVGIGGIAASGLGARVGFGALGRPLGDGVGGVEVRGIELVPSLGALWLVELGRLAIGPTAEAQLAYSSAAVRAGGAATVAEGWRFRLAIGGELRVRLAARVALVAAVGVAYAATRDEYRGDTTGDVLYAAPRVALRAAVGVALLPESGGRSN